MAGSITASTLTTVCIFLPLIMFQQKIGMMGQLFSSFAFTIVFSLLCSLLVAIAFVPVISSKYLVIEKSSKVKKGKILTHFDNIMGRFFNWLDNAYARGVSWVLKHKVLVLSFIAILLLYLFYCS